MRKGYLPGHILALQHETLTRSPLQNLEQLAACLPNEATLDIISHSRGGLVADLLCRFCTNENGFGSEEKLFLEKNNRHADLQSIEKIERIMAGKKIAIRNLVRVACPAAGTNLAGNRLNCFFNVTFNLLGLATGQAANPVYIAFKDLIIAAIESKDNHDVLPGIEAMHPDSAFIKVLNFAGASITLSNPLLVIAGSSQVSLRWRGLLILAARLLFRGDNDLIVDTQSMTEGALRSSGKAFYYLEKTAGTYHFGYFQNDSSLEKIKWALEYSGEGQPAGFLPIKQRLMPEISRQALLGLAGGHLFRDRPSGNRPIVLLLPGIMGSNLQVKENVVWINYLRFLRGELASLEYEPGKNQHIKPHSLVRSSYKKLADYLESQYDVITFPFDWRRQVNDCTDELDRRILQLMEFNQPLKVIAHSMGGVLFRDFILRHPATWRRLNASTGFRLVMLGTPLGGSFRIPFVLFGFDEIISKLAKIDIRHSKKDLLQIFCNLPGLHSLLPLHTSGPYDFADPAVWAGMAAAMPVFGMACTFHKRFASIQKIPGRGFSRHGAY